VAVPSARLSHQHKADAPERRSGCGLLVECHRWPCRAPRVRRLSGPDRLRLAVRRCGALRLQQLLGGLSGVRPAVLPGVHAHVSEVSFATVAHGSFPTCAKSVPWRANTTDFSRCQGSSSPDPLFGAALLDSSSGTLAAERSRDGKMAPARLCATTGIVDQQEIR
jgi:hypothetical protein